GVVLVIGVLAAQFLRRDPTKMGLVPYGQHEEGEKGSASGAAGYTLKEATETWQFWMLTLIFFCLGYCIFSIVVHLVPHVTDLGISATTAANMLAVMGALGIISGVVLGGAIDKIGNRWVCAITFIMIAVSVLGLAAVTQIWMLYLLAVVYGLSSGGGAITESTLIVELFGMKSHGSILGVVSFAFTVGGALGPFLTGYIFDITAGYQLAFLICVAVAAVAIIALATLRPIKRPSAL
ncbi:unnamed protein product, partial [marine sediment metagenome]